jgi:O-methyltransferase
VTPLSLKRLFGGGPSVRDAHPGSLRHKMAVRGRTEYSFLGYDEEDQAVAAVHVVDNNTMVSYPKLVSLWHQVRHLDRAGIPGCLVECGTWRGGSSAMMALAHRAHGEPTRRIHLFDSFQGLPEPDRERDGEKAIEYARGNASGKLSSIGKCVGQLEENRRVMLEVAGHPETLTEFHEGWFQETVPRDAAKVGPIALLRLDGDWYESTRICLEHLLPLVVPGGFLIIDDFGEWVGCRVAVQEWLAGLERPLYANRIGKAGWYFIMPN